MNKKAKKNEQGPSSAQRVRGVGTALIDYFRSLKYEWQKVTFPTRKELTQSTVVVFLFTLLLMAVISLYDVAMSFVFNKLVLPVD